jgi:hypothetical protein
MPTDYVVSPDDSYIASQVIKPHKWDVWRLCTEYKCYRGLHYGASAGMDVRQTILKTVVDEREVLHLVVNITKWNPKDLATFEKTYELSDLRQRRGR